MGALGWAGSILGALVGLGVLVAGIRLAVGARGAIREAGEDGAASGPGLGSGFGAGFGLVHPQTRLTLGLVLAIAGYHAAAWSLPPGWIPLRVPIERWWVLTLALLAGVGLTLLADRIERRGDDRDAPPNGD